MRPSEVFGGLNVEIPEVNLEVICRVRWKTDMGRDSGRG
jgi:hypothetical protein